MATRPRRLLFVSTGLGTGGAEMMLLKLAGALPASEFQLSVITLRDRGTIGPRLEAAGVPVHALNLHRPRQALMALPRAWRLVCRLRPDLLAGWMYHGNLMASLLWRLDRRRAVLVWSIRQTLYALDDEPRLTRRVIQLGASASRSPAAIIYNSDLAARQHSEIGYAANHAVVIPNGFDVARFQPRPDARPALRQRLGIAPEALVVGHVARYHPMKDHTTFLRAAAAVAGEGRVEFVCAGRGVDQDNPELVAQVQQLGLTGRVHLLGEIPDVASLLPVFDCLCSSSSRGEGFPNVLGEAMACAIPCVVTDVGDSAAIVGETGLVVPPARPDLLARALIEMLWEPIGARRARGAAARSRVMREFSLPTIAERYATLFRDVLPADDYQGAGLRA